MSVPACARTGRGRTHADHRVGDRQLHGPEAGCHRRRADAYPRVGGGRLSDRRCDDQDAGEVERVLPRQRSAACPRRARLRHSSRTPGDMSSGRSTDGVARRSRHRAQAGCGRRRAHAHGGLVRRQRALKQDASEIHASLSALAVTVAEAIRDSAQGIEQSLDHLLEHHHRGDPLERAGRRALARQPVGRDDRGDPDRRAGCGTHADGGVVRRHRGA